MLCFRSRCVRCRVTADNAEAGVPDGEDRGREGVMAQELFPMQRVQLSPHTGDIPESRGCVVLQTTLQGLFRPKVVVEDEAEARKERLLRRPKMIVLESKPEALPEDVVRSTNKPDYGLEELSSASLKQKFAMFEQITTEEEKRPETIPVRRSQSLLGKAARFMQSEDDDYGIENSELGEYEEYDDDEEDDDEEEEEVEGEDGEIIKKKKGRPTSFSGMQDLKAGFVRKNRQEELSKRRREELTRFRQMLCAGKNISTREMFEGGNDEDGQPKRKEQIKIDGCPAAKNLRERFEKGLSISEENEESEEKREVDHVFRQAETASKARNMFKQIDTAVVEGEEPVMRPRSSAQARRDNRLSRDGKRIRNFASQVFDDENDSNEEDEGLETSSLVERFKFFATYEDRAKEDKKKPRKLFRLTPPRDGEDQGIDVEERELGRDPNLIKCTDNYEDAVDCRGTRDLLAKFKKMEMENEDDDSDSPRPLKRFTPPPDGEEYDSEDEYTDEEYSDEEDDSEEDDEEDEDDEEERKPKYKDEILEMSARKAASLRAKFEKWESEVERNNEHNHNDQVVDEEEEGMPSIDTARNLRAMFENKAQEAAKPVANRPKLKVNRFVGGGGDKCMSCDRTVYAMERLEVAAKVLHKNCFKCCKCNTRLSMNTFSIGGNDMYCTTHYKQAFTEKGTYDVFTPNKELHKQYKISVH
ncbi:hypothetical protein Pcinc_022075 [Petrolisthes cinctipes]|uniref:LIM zinc-binding domain-containing protein n=1 Tax=Petrolisthes cinctipes TaxID=88211 RepID=A0AAE1FFD8_PETCI|nr:hypothetical protein Pcinc_022075 [Petrolisthes cinctipes]